MNKIEAMHAFCAVAEHRSFSRAALERQISATMVSRYVKQLEQQLGCQLLKRNTRNVTLTSAGQQYQHQIEPVLKKITAIDNTMLEYQAQPSGKLVVSTSIEFGGQYLAPLIAEYREAYPQVALELRLSNTPVNVFDSDIDVVFRIAPKLPNASHIAQTVCQSRLSLWASPAYLNDYGTPDTPSALRQHKLLFFSHSIRKDQWLFTIDKQQHALTLPWDWTSNNGRLLNEAACQAQGIIQAPKYSVASYLSTGQLVEVMPSYAITPLPISAIYPHRYALANRVKSFVELAKQYFAHHPIA